MTDRAAACASYKLNVRDADNLRTFVLETTKSPINRDLIAAIDHDRWPSGEWANALIEKLVDMLDAALDNLLAMYAAERIAMWFDDRGDQRGFAVDDYVVFVARTEYKRQHPGVDPYGVLVEVAPVWTYSGTHVSVLLTAPPAAGC